MLCVLEKYHHMGLILIPMSTKVDPSTNKVEKFPLIPYKGFKEKGQDWITLQGLYETHKEKVPLQWAVYCTNGVVGLDFDCPNDYETFLRDIDTLTTKSPSGGYHVILKTLVDSKPFKKMGFEYKSGELCTIIGDGYEIVKDLPIKEISDVKSVLEKRFPELKIKKESKDIPLIEVLTKYEVQKGRSFHGGWRTACPIHGDNCDEHFYYYEDTNSWYCHKCKKGGDAASFVMALKNCSFKESLAIINQLLGIEQQEKDDEKTKYVGVSTVKENDILYEQVLTAKGYKFVFFNGAYNYLEKIPNIKLITDKNDAYYIPCEDEEITKGMVKIPGEPLNYIDLKTLLQDIDCFIYKWLDISDQARKFNSYYILQTWVYENFHSIGYARALGDLGTGKTRFLDVIGLLCYKPMVLTGAVGAAPIFRIMDKHHGTLVIDEANFAQTDETAAILQIFNSGYEKGKPVIRVNTDDLSKINVFDPFCPKVLGTRKKFTDAALESRCYTEVMTQTSRDDIPALLNDVFFQELDVLTRKLLDFRMRNINVIKPDESLQADFLGIEPRIVQKNLPLAAIVKSDPDAYKEFIEYTKSSQEDLIEDRQGSWEGMVVCAILSLYEEGLSKNPLENILISGEDIAEKLNEDLPEKKKTNSQRVGKMLKTLGFNRIKKGVSSGKDEKEKTRKFKRALDTDLKLLAKLVRRYTFFDDENYPELRKLVSSVSSTYGGGIKLNNDHNSVTELIENTEKIQIDAPSAVLDTLDSLDTQLKEFGDFWQKNHGQINSENKVGFCMDFMNFCKQKGNENENISKSILKVVEKIFKVTPNQSLMIEADGELSEVVVE